jgi:hypothetical protein
MFYSQPFMVVVFQAIEVQIAEQWKRPLVGVLTSGQGPIGGGAEEEAGSGLDESAAREHGGAMSK